MGGLTTAALAERTGATEADVDRMAALGVIVPREGAAPFSDSDIAKVRLARACEDAGLPLEGVGQAIDAGRLSFAFLEGSSYRRWSARSGQTYREACASMGIPFEVLSDVLEAIGFPPMQPDERIREDELEVTPLVQLALTSGILDESVMVQIARVYADGLRRIAKAEAEVYHSQLEMPLLASGMSQRQLMDVASQVGQGFPQLMDRALMAAYRRQQELAWMEDIVEHVEAALEDSGVRPRPERVPAMCFLDLAGYTRLTEEQGDEAAADLAASLAGLVGRSSRAAGGLPVKWLGDGVMFHFREPAGAVLSALEMVAEIPEAGLPPAHVGVAAGPVVAQGGDYFGRTVNMASRIASRAGAGQVLVSESVVQTGSSEGVRFVDLGEVDLKGIAKPVRVFEAQR